MINKIFFVQNTDDDGTQKTWKDVSGPNLEGSMKNANEGGASKIDANDD